MKYLSNHSIISSGNFAGKIDTLNNLILDLECPFELDETQRKKKFAASVGAVPVGDLGLIYFSFDNVNNFRIKASGYQSEMIALVIPTSGQALVKQRGEEFCISENTGFFRDMRLPFFAELRNFSALNLCMPIDALRIYIRSLIGQKANLTNLEFSQLVDLTNQNGQHLKRTLIILAQQIDKPSAEFQSKVVMDHWANLLLSLIFNTQPSTHLELVQISERSLAVPYYVRNARHHIHANCGRKITLIELARHAKCSSRTLQAAFKDIYGISPMAYLKSVRLSRIRNELMLAEKNIIIHDTADKWGYSHMGRLAKDYKEQFGELPSETRRRRP